MRDTLDEAKIEKMSESLMPDFAAFNEATEKNDDEAHRRILARMVNTQREIDRWLATQAAKMSSALDVSSLRSDEERIAQLLQAFAFGGKLARICTDIIGDAKAGNKAEEQAYGAGHAIKAIDTDGKLPLAVFLDDPDPSVRAIAASLLVEIIPDRALPVLEEIVKVNSTDSAGLTAFWALTMHKIDLKK